MSIPNTMQQLINILNIYLCWQEGDDIFPKDAEDKIIPGEAHFTDAWKEMEKLVEEGLIKSIGISNFNSKQIEELLAVAKIKPVTNQVNVGIVT